LQLQQTVITVFFLFISSSSSFHSSFVSTLVHPSMAESSDYVRPSIPRFDGFYDHWEMLMENFLRSKDLWELVEVGVTVAPENATAEQQQEAAAGSRSGAHEEVSSASTIPPGSDPRGT
jgi:hypothetical protein